MTPTIDYYFATISPYAYLGFDRFAAIAAKYQATVAVKPINLGEVFPVSGGLPLSKRAPQRQAYRLVELERWRKHLGVPMTIQPKFFPYDAKLAALSIIAAGDVDQAMKLTGAFLRGCWAEEKNMADEAEIKAAICSAGLDGDALLRRAGTPETAAQFEAFTDEAIARQVFGAPTYVYRNELFWGQDRLEFLDRALASG